MNLPSYVFDVDHVVKIRSELPITVLEKQTTKSLLKNVTFRKSDIKMFSKNHNFRQKKVHEEVYKSFS